MRITSIISLFWKKKLSIFLQIMQASSGKTFLKQLGNHTLEHSSTLWNILLVQKLDTC